MHWPCHTLSDKAVTPALVCLALKAILLTSLQSSLLKIVSHFTVRS